MKEIYFYMLKRLKNYTPCFFFRKHLYKQFQSKASLINGIKKSLREKCPNKELFLDRIFLYSD